MRHLRAHGPLSVEQLCSLTGVSPATIRRDLQALEELGALTRVHGGAVVSEAVADADLARPYAEVAAADAADKAAVAARAAALVVDGQSVLLDIGTTTTHLAEALRGRAITVITANLAAFDVLREDDEVELILLGGSVRRPYHSLVGALTDHTIRLVRADHVFLGASGLTRDGTVLDTTSAEVPVKRALLRAGGEVSLLVDRHKLPGSGALRVCQASELTRVVTNDGADGATLSMLRSAGVEVLTA